MVELNETKHSKLTLEEFRTNYKYNDSYSKSFFELFDIKCKKCNSSNIEIFGISDGTNCYYPEDNPSRHAIIKCHCCGNAKVFDLDSGSYSDVEELD
jgi:hypothetical protein